MYYIYVMMSLQASSVVLMVTVVCLTGALSYPLNQASNYNGEERAKRSIPGEVVKRLLRDALLVGGDATTIWYQKLGGFTRAMDDFAKSNPSEVKSFARGVGQIGHIGNRHIFIIRESHSSGMIGITEETVHFQREDIYINYIE